MKIRSITVFARVTPEMDPKLLTWLGAFAQLARQSYERAGYEVQTTRLAMDIFPALARSPWAEAPVGFAITLEKACRAQGFEYIALGPAGRAMWLHLPGILSATETTFVSIHLTDPATGVVLGEAVRSAARVVRQTARINNGFDNLRFAALANVPPGTPFFPAAYYDGGAPSFAIATQAADLAVDACIAAQDAEEAQRRLAEAIEAEAERLVVVAGKLAQSHDLRFGGIDFSLAPFPTPESSIGAALERLSGQPAGSAGTLAAAAVLTAAISQARFPRTGFCGLMLPVLEDTVLAQRAAEGRLRIGELLQWSAACGTGLDTVPLPGDVGEGVLAGLLFDVATLSARLRKPLTARLMPLPGKAPGDRVHFDFAYFADGGVLCLEGGEKQGLLGKTTSIGV